MYYGTKVGGRNRQGSTKDDYYDEKRRQHIHTHALLLLTDSWDGKNVDAHLVMSDPGAFPIHSLTENSILMGCPAVGAQGGRAGQS